MVQFQVMMEGAFLVACGMYEPKYVQRKTLVGFKDRSFVILSSPALGHT
jgi:hypothetical protein